MRRSALSRRKTLNGAGGSILAPARPLRRSMNADAIGPVMARLSAYMSAAENRALPEPVIEKTKHHVLDTIAAMISGAALPPGRAAIAFARGYGGKAVATVAASRIVCGPIEAALANGVLAHADETDDSHGPSRSIRAARSCRLRSRSASSSACRACTSCARSRSATTSAHA